MSTPVLATKLFPPTRRTTVVPRPRLVTLLNTTLAPGHRLTLVAAPAGFGKSTLLGDWASTHTDEETAVAWLSLDDGDNAMARFLAHVWAALSGTGLAFTPEHLDALAVAPATTVMSAMVNELVRACERWPTRQWLLVLDDYHVITAAEVHQALSFLLEHLPDHAHILIATRADPVLPLPRMRSRGELTEIRAADLRFTAIEAQEYLTGAMGLDLTEGDVVSLQERTEGWITGLQLAALSLRDLSEQRDVGEFINQFTGTHRFIIDYLVDEVLARQSDDVRVFLLRTAILDRLSGPLCDAVTGRTNSGQVLEDLDRGNVFLIPLDTQRTWYRYHHLFASVLRARLLAEWPGELPALHRAASRWCSEHELVADAVRHALAAGDHTDGARLMEAALPELRRTRQDSLLLGWMSALPDPVVRRSPVLGLASAWSRLMSGDLEGAERRLDGAEAALAAGATDPGLAKTWVETEDLRTAPATVSLYRAAVAQARGDIPATARHARTVLDIASSHERFLRGGATGFLGLAAWAAGDVDEALATFTEAVDLLHAAGNLVDALDSTVVLGDMWLTAGRPLRARRVCEQALATATRHGQPYPRATADFHVALAGLDREQGNLAGAAEHLETARRLGEHDCITENRHRWFVVMAQVRAAAGDLAGADQLLDEADALYRPGFYPELRPIPALRARLHIRAGDLEAAGAWERSRPSPRDAETFQHEYDLLTLVRLELARHRTPSGVEAYAGSLDDLLALLDRLHTAADPQRAGSLLEIGMLRALAHQARRDRQAALAVLDSALARAPEPAGYARLFLDEGAPMLNLLTYAVSDNRESVSASLRQHALRLIELAGSGVPGSRATPPGSPDSAQNDGDGLRDPLSARELEVLRQLRSDLTGPAIARRLFVSLNTLRTHTKRIFTKLGVNSRAQAVRRGRELGLL